MDLTDILWMISEIIKVVYIICIINCLLVKKNNARIKSIGIIIILTVVYSMTGVTYALHKGYISMGWINIALLFGLNIVIYIAYEGSIVKKLLTFIIPHIIITSTELLINQIEKHTIFTKDIIKIVMGFEDIVFYIIKQSAILLIYLILYTCCRKLQYKYRNLDIKYNRVISNFIVFYFTSIIMLYFFDIPSISNSKLVYIVAAFGIASGLYTIVHFIINGEIGKNLDELKIIQEQQINYYHAIQENIDRTRKFRHDIANHINMIQVLKEEKKATFSEDVKRDNDSNYKVLRTLFDYYCEKSNESNIHIEIEDFHYEGICISEYDLVTICKNLLENAWEACLKDDETIEKYINICFEETESFLRIIVENSKSKIQRMNKEWGTTKEDKELHGLGMKIVSDICQRNHGQMEYIEEANRFVVIIVLKL